MRSSSIDHRLCFAGGYRDALRHRPVLEPLPDLDPHRSGGNGDFDLAGAVEEPAEVADRRFALAVSLARFGPLAGQAVGGERVGRGLVEVAVGSDDIEPAERRPASRAVANRDLEPAGLLSRRRLCQSRLSESGRRDEICLVISRRTPRCAKDDHHAPHGSP